jgi:hypothetical protein
MRPSELRIIRIDELVKAWNVGTGPLLRNAREPLEKAAHLGAGEPRLGCNEVVGEAVLNSTAKGCDETARTASFVHCDHGSVMQATSGAARIACPLNPRPTSAGRLANRPRLPPTTMPDPLALPGRVTGQRTRPSPSDLEQADLQRRRPHAERQLGLVLTEGGLLQMRFRRRARFIATWRRLGRLVRPSAGSGCGVPVP